MVEKQKLLNSTHRTGTLSSTAVANAPRTDVRPPSPTSPIDLAVGAPSFAPIAAPGEKPIVAMPPLVMNERGRFVCSCWPAPFLFQPTSVTKMASSGAASERARATGAPGGWGYPASLLGLRDLGLPIALSPRHVLKLRAGMSTGPR